MTKNTPTGFNDADDFYQRLVEAHEALDEKQAQRFDLVLILLLANHIGDKKTLAAYIKQAQTDAAEKSGE